MHVIKNEFVLKGHLASCIIHEIWASISPSSLLVCCVYVVYKRESTLKYTITPFITE